MASTPHLAKKLPNAGVHITGGPVGKPDFRPTYAAAEPVDDGADQQISLYFGFVVTEVPAEIKVEVEKLDSLVADDVNKALATFELLLPLLRNEPQRVVDYLNRSSTAKHFTTDLTTGPRLAPTIDLQELGRMLYIIGGVALASATETDNDTM